MICFTICTMPSTIDQTSNCGTLAAYSHAVIPERDLIPPFQSCHIYHSDTGYQKEVSYWLWNAAGNVAISPLLIQTTIFCQEYLLVPNDKALHTSCTCFIILLVNIHLWLSGYVTTSNVIYMSHPSNPLLPYLNFSDIEFWVGWLCLAC